MLPLPVKLLSSSAARDGWDGEWLQAQRSHDVPYLLRRWRAVARAAKLRLTTIHETGGHPVYFLTTRHISARPLYFSTGVHGDEAASVLGLLEWAERNIEELRGGDAILIPLFNPAGLALNLRTDGAGEDLNRCFDHLDNPHIAGWRSAMAGYVPRLAVCLHEDYDAQGLYAYELNFHSRLRPAQHCLASAHHILPRDPRHYIEGRPARAGVIRPRKIPMTFDLPEAVALYEAGTACTITFETPSEFSLAQRTRAHVHLLQSITTWAKHYG